MSVCIRTVIWGVGHWCSLWCLRNSFICNEEQTKLRGHYYGSFNAFLFKKKQRKGLHTSPMAIMPHLITDSVVCSDLEHFYSPLPSPDVPSQETKPEHSFPVFFLFNQVTKLWLSTYACTLNTPRTPALNYQANRWRERKSQLILNDFARHNNI